MVAIGGRTGAAETLLALANAAASNSSLTGQTTRREPHTLWLQNLAIAIEVLAVVLSIVSCSLRAYIRTKTKNLGWDDYWMFGAVVLCIAQAATSILYIKVGYIGIHNAEIPSIDPVRFGLIAYINGLIYNPILSMVKISVLLFLLRLAGTKPRARVAIWALLVFTTCLMIAIFFCVIFVCDPVSYVWDHKQDGHCFDKKPFAMATSGITLFTDLLTLVLPFWIFIGLRMPKKAKMALLGVFALGFIVTIIGIVRLYFLYANNYLPKGPDSSFNIGFVTNALETNLAVVAACGPALWPLARRWFPRAFSNLGLSRGYQGDIPDIDVTDKGEASGVTSSSRKSKRSFLFKLASGNGSRDKNGEDGAGGAGAKAGVHANHTIGGSAFVLKEIRGDRARGHTEIRHHTPHESEEEIMTYNGIMRTTDYTVTRVEDHRGNSSETEAPWMSYPRRGATRQDPALRSSMGSI